MTRLIEQAEVRERLLAAVLAVPPGVKLSLSFLRDALVSQADVVAGIEALIAAGRIDRQTLRPAAASVRVTTGTVRVTAARGAAAVGTDLAAALQAYAATHGLALHRVSKHLFGGANVIARLRTGTKPRPKTEAKVRAFLAAPPPRDLKLRPAGGARVPNVGGVTGAELAAELDALIAQHGLLVTLVGLHLVGQRSGVETIRHSNPRRKTFERIRAFLADPPLKELQPRDSWTGRRAAAAAKRLVAPKPSPAVGLTKQEHEAIHSPACAANRASPCGAATPANRAESPRGDANQPNRPSLTFEEQLGRVERGEVGIAANIRIGRADPSGTLGGVTGEINL